MTNKRITLQSGDYIKLSDIPNEQVFNLVKGCFINAGFNDKGGIYAQYSDPDKHFWKTLLITDSETHCYGQIDSLTNKRQVSLSDVFNSVNGEMDWQGFDYIHFFKDGYISYSNDKVLYPLIDTHPIKRIPDSLEAIIPPKPSQWWDYENGVSCGVPPVDTECEYSLNNGRLWYKCEVISQHKLVLHCPHLENDDWNGLQVVGENEKVSFRPLDWEKLSKRKQVVNKALDVFAKGFTDRGGMLALYDAGMLKEIE